MPCSQPEDGDLLGSVHLVGNMVFLRSHLQTLPPCDLELASQDGFGFLTQKNHNCGLTVICQPTVDLPNLHIDPNLL